MNTLEFQNINSSLRQMDAQFQLLEHKELANWNWTKDLSELAEAGLSTLLEQHNWLNECQLIFQDNQLFIKQPNNVGILVSIYHIDYSEEIIEFLKTQNLSLSNLTALKTSLIMFLSSVEQGIEILTKKGLDLEDGILSYGYDFNRAYSGRKLVPLPMKTTL